MLLCFIDQSLNSSINCEAILVESLLSFEGYKYILQSQWQEKQISIFGALSELNKAL